MIFNNESDKVSHFYGTITAMQEAVRLYDAHCLHGQMQNNPRNGYGEEIKPLADAMRLELERKLENAINRATQYWTLYKAHGKKR